MQVPVRPPAGTTQRSPAGHPAAVSQTGVAPRAQVAEQVVSPAPERQHASPPVQLSSLEHSITTPPSGHWPAPTHVRCVTMTPPSPRTRAVQHSIGGSQVRPAPQAIAPASPTPPVLVLLLLLA
jgi:hypothetical protein